MEKDYELHCGDCLEWMRAQPDGSVDLVLSSPPYEAARTYGIDFDLKAQAFVDWAVERYLECLRISKGLVAWVVEGQTRNFKYSAAPILIMADLHRAGVKLRKPPAFFRVGIPGSGGPDWIRNDYEFVICASHGKLPWSDNTACGHAPKWAPGGEMSNRITDGTRRNQCGHSGTGKHGARTVDGTQQTAVRPGHFIHTKKNGTTVLRQKRQVMSIDRDGTHDQSQVGYTVPVKANPGNVIQEKYTAEQVGRLVMELIGESSDVQKHIVGGGLMGHKLAHENEAPFPLTLAEFYVRSFCPPGGRVLDPFCGSGTTIHAAAVHGRKGIGIDCRQSQVDLTDRRLQDVLSAARSNT